MKVIVGLGNPGEKYQDTRHNLGFRVVEGLGLRNKDLGLSWKYEEKFKSEMMSVNYFLGPKSYQLVLIKPQTHMNNSGFAVAKMADYFKVKPENVVVIHDELDLPLGKIKIRQGGSAAGHHGVESIIKALGDDKFIRVRLGIGNVRAVGGERDGKHFDAEQFVIEKFTSTEKVKVKQLIKKAVIALELLIKEGTEVAQNQFN